MANLIVEDAEDLTLSILAASISETGTTTATVTRSNTNVTSPLVVTVTVGDPSEVSAPTTVTIPANTQSSDPFTITGINDGIVDGTQTVTLTASATGYVNGSDTLDVTDVGVPTFPEPVAYWNFDEGTGDVAADTSTAGTDNSAQLKNTATWTTEGFVGPAVSLDGGSAYVFVPDTIDLNQAPIATVRTVVGWF